MSSPAPHAPLELSLVQRWFQAVITHPGGVAAGAASAAAQECFSHGQASQAVGSLVTDSSKLDAEARLAVYADAYYARLVECLGDVFPVLKRTLGEEVFHDFAFDYLQAYPSRRYTLNVLGTHFAEFLSTNRPPRESETTPDWADFIIDLARFEWVIYEVFDGPGTEDVPSFNATQLTARSAEDPGKLRLQIAPCLRLFRADFPVSDFFTAARKAAPDDALEAPNPSPTFVAISRTDYVVRRHPLQPAEHAALAALVGGATVGDAIIRALAAESVAPEQIEAWFARWAREGFFTGVG
ncbi:MAG TPA: DNA-binding domain-containing protein [Verrucomicrobiota bacterium]|nr:hypothetical protein [Verrucomicrobiales bacterium]HRI15475.1 DNA-binding domain-containing protein [Verrucomicrobiota bacterium]